MDISSIEACENDITERDIPAFNVLLKQLNANAPVVEFEAVNRVVQKGGVILTLRDASRGGTLIGMGTLLPILKYYYSYGNIEDVVVDELYRRCHLGRSIVVGLILKSQGLIKNMGG